MAEQNTVPSVTAAIVGVTDVGRVREHNEDSFLVVERDGGRRPKSGEPVDVTLRTAALMVVCDGMGGAAAGEVASRMAADRVAQVLGEADLSDVSPDQIASLMDRAVQQANTEIFEKARANPDFKGMGTTLTAAIATPGRLFVSQVGDSRAYILRKGLLNQITKDQSLIGQLIEEGTLTEEEAEKLGGRNIVLQAVGVEDSLRVDTKNWPILRGDVLVLCSDGLSGMVRDARIREIVAEAGNDVLAAGKKLVEEANANGGRDNVTVVIARFDGEGLRPPMETGDGPIEAAGASFKAPPPPEVPNPMKKVGMWGAALLAVIAASFLLLRPTTSDIELTVHPRGAHVELIDPAGNVVRKEVATGDTLRIAGVDLGKYVLRATAERHFEQKTKEFEIDQTGTSALSPLRLQPKPATLLVSTKVPGVTVTVRVTSPHDAYTPVDETFRLPEAGNQRSTGNVPPGNLSLRAARPGFRDFVFEAALTPDAETRVEVGPTDEVTASLVVEAPPGFSVRVLTEEGAEVAKGDVSAEGTWSARVRVGRLTVVATAPGYREHRSPAFDLAEGGSHREKVEARAEEVRVRVRGLADRVEVVAETFADGEWRRASSRALEGGETKNEFRLAPGRWRVRYDDAEAGSGVEFAAEPGSPALVVDLEARTVEKSR